MNNKDILLNNGLTLITGPTMSGKSEWAEYLISDKKDVTYIATSISKPDDPEWLERLSIHQKRRPKYWQTIESNGDLNNWL